MVSCKGRLARYHFSTSHRSRFARSTLAFATFINAFRLLILAGRFSHMVYRHVQIGYVHLLSSGINIFINLRPSDPFE